MATPVTRFPMLSFVCSKIVGSTVHCITLVTLVGVPTMDRSLVSQKAALCRETPWAFTTTEGSHLSL